MAADSARRRGARPRRRWELSRRGRIVLGSAVGGTVLLIGAYMLVDYLMVKPPPEIQAATPQQIAEYLGDSRGLARLSLPKREEYLVHVVETYNSDPVRCEQLSRALGQLSYEQQQQFLDAVFEIGKDKVMKAAAEYKRTPPVRRRRFVDDVIRNVDAFRNSLAGPARAQAGPGGGAAPVPTLVSPFEKHIPKKSDQWTKMIVSRTSPAERAQAKDLVDDLAARYDQLRHDPRAAEEFNRGT